MKSHILLSIIQMNETLFKGKHNLNDWSVWVSRRWLFQCTVSNLLRMNALLLQYQPYHVIATITKLTPNYYPLTPSWWGVFANVAKKFNHLK